jgi:surfeit locus 1 family protein
MKAQLLPRNQQAWIILLAALVAGATTARLGWWQLDRAQQKTDRQEALNRQRALPPISREQLPLNPSQAAAAEHRRVSLQGQWRDTHTVYLDNRSMAGRVGFFVLTPLTLEGGAVVLVQRGFWPRHVSDPRRVDAPAAPAGLVQVQGRLALAPSRMFELAELGQGSVAPQGRIRQNVEPVVHASETGLPLLPWVLIQEDWTISSIVSSATNSAAGASASTPASASAAAPTAATGDLALSAGPTAAADGLLRQWPQADLGKQKNLGYALQWFAMAVLVLVLYLWFQVFKPMRVEAVAHRTHP